MNKYQIDNLDSEAEREGQALDKQGQAVSQQHKRHKYSKDYNTAKFDKLFRN